MNGFIKQAEDFLASIRDLHAEMDDMTTDEILVVGSTMSKAVNRLQQAMNKVEKARCKLRIHRSDTRSA